MSNPHTLPAIILAAGLSTRMGAFKPLLNLGGKTLLTRVIESLEASGAISEILVVSGHRADEVRSALGDRKGVRIVHNSNYASGEMLSSVKTGVAALPPAEGFLLAFADQPAVRADTIAGLIEQFFAAKAPIVVPTYAGKRGHPVILSATLIPEIQKLAADSSLKQVVHAHGGETAGVPVADPSVLVDVDTPEDFARAEAALAGQ